MKQTQKNAQKKTLTLNKMTVSMFNNNAVNAKNGNKFHFTSVIDTTGSMNCQTSVTK